MPLDLMIPVELQAMVDREIEGSERVEWMGQPAAKFFTSKSTPLFLFSIPWTLFTLFWIAAAGGAEWFTSTPSGFSLFPLFGIPFLIIGIGLMLTPVFAYRKARRTVYVVTNKRAIIFAGGKSITVQSYLPEQLHEVSRREKADGTGDVIITKQLLPNANGRVNVDEIGFFRIQDPHQVEKRLKELAALDTPKS